MIMKSKKANEIFLTVSPIYEKSKIMKSIFEAIGNELDISNKYVEEIKNQLFPQTATWAISIWEQRLGLTTNKDESIEKRRGKVIAKIQSKYIITPERMAFIIKNYTGTDVLIVENVAPYTFKIVINIDCLEDTLELKTIVKKIKPSHLSWIPDFTFNFINNEIFDVPKTINRFFLNFRGNIPLMLDGSWVLNGQNIFNGYEVYWEPINVRSTNRLFVENTESFKSNVRIEKNLWYLDGSYNLDGYKILNAEIREEVI